MKQEWIEKMYAGYLGMDAGMRLGAPVENPYWTYDRLRTYYGDIRGYLREYKTTHDADDDVNGPTIFLRALTDFGADKPLTAEHAGETWLNYARCGMGMFWWGGEELSTEHRAYMNLRRGVPAPQSGSIALNGKTAAEQIGGQIFIDTWGLIWPGCPQKAAEYARIAASVSHDGEALNGAAFVAGCIAAAFVCGTVEQVMDEGLRQIPADCSYHRMAEAVREFYARHPDDFRACRDYVDAEWGGKYFPGDYHIVTNGAICVLALLYGGGDFGRTIEIACMCGFDTDCNASSVGTIMGVLGGLEGIGRRYRGPINDSVVLSSVSGYLNIVDVPTFAKELASIACRLRGEALPESVSLPEPGSLLFDFELPGSTHGLRLSDHSAHELRAVEGVAHTGRRCLELMTDGKAPEPADVSFQAMYLRSDFHDDRYDPVFTPRVSPGQRVSCWMLNRPAAPAVIRIIPFVTLAMSGRRIDLPAAVLPAEQWTPVTFTVPDLAGDEAHEIGWRVEVTPTEDVWAWNKVYLDDITVTGPMDYTIDPAIQRMEFRQATPFSFNDCQCSLRDGKLWVTAGPENAAGQGFTGNYYLRGCTIQAEMQPREGAGAGLILRGQGCRRYYALGFDGKDRVSVVRCDAGQTTELAAADFPWVPGHAYTLAASAEGDALSLCVDGKKVLEAADSRFAYGMVGLCQRGPGASVWSGFRITGDTGR